MCIRLWAVFVLCSVFVFGVGCKKNGQDPIVGTWSFGKKTVEIKADGSIATSQAQLDSWNKGVQACERAGKKPGAMPKASWVKKDGSYELETWSFRTKHRSDAPCSWQKKTHSAELDGDTLKVALVASERRPGGPKVIEGSRIK